MVDVLLTHSYFYKLDKKQWKNQTPFPPLATLYAASYLRENGNSISFFDVGLKNNPSEIIPMVLEDKPRILVIYDDGFNYLTKMCLTVMRQACFELIKIGKSNQCKVIVSSSDATDHADKYLNIGADFVIYGEGEVTLLELVKSITNKNSSSVHIKYCYN